MTSKHVDYTNYPRKSEYSSKEEQLIAAKKFFKDKGMKHISEFNDDEKSAIVTKSVVNFVNKEVLSQKYNTMPHVIGHFVHGMGFRYPPKDMSEYPDWPRKSNEMSLDEYRKVIRKYWNKKTRSKL